MGKNDDVSLTSAEEQAELEKQRRAQMKAEKDAKRVKYCRQRQYVDMMSKPAPIRGYPPKSPEISKPALKAKCSQRLQLMAKPVDPKPKIPFMTTEEKEEYLDMIENMTPEERRDYFKKPPIKIDSGVKESALHAECPPQLETLALPKAVYIADTMRTFAHRLKRRHKRAIMAVLEKHREIYLESNPPDGVTYHHLLRFVMVHKRCCPNIYKIGLFGKPPKFLCSLNKKQRTQFLMNMKQMSIAVPTPQPEYPDRGPAKNIEDFEPRLTEIAQPIFHEQVSKPNPFEVSRAALKYEATERILEISRPNPEKPLVDWEGNELPPLKEWTVEMRQRVKASPRLCEIALPKFVKKKLTEADPEDPFAVKKRALTAYCSPRIKELAEPSRKG